MRRNKHKAVKVSYKGIKFASKGECRRYKELELLESIGEISDLKPHPKFILQDKFRAKSGKAIQAIKYTADYEYTENGRHIIEDFKGGSTKTEAFMIRIKLFIRQNPQIVFRISEAHRQTFKTMDY